MKVAFCSVPGVDDKQYWSGTPYFMARHLREAFTELIPIGPLQLFSQPFREKYILYTKALRENYLCELEPVLHRCLSAEVTRHLRMLNGIDVIVSPGCFPYPNIFLDTEIPVVFWSDATFAGLLDIYPNYQNLCAENIWCGEKLQQKMLDSGRLALFTSKWAADSACNHYGTDPDKVQVVPFGANLHFTIENEDELELVLSKRQAGICRLLLIARHWHERNGEFALAVLNAVQAAGLKSTLVVAGCHLPPQLAEAAAGKVNIEVHPILSKDAGASEQSYVRLLASAHFLLHPSFSTCYGIAICEANAWGLPVLAHNAGGVGSVIINGENGYSFSTGKEQVAESRQTPPVSKAQRADPGEYANKIVTLFANQRSYLDLCRTSWWQFKTRLNWSNSARQISRLLEKL